MLRKHPGIRIDSIPVKGLAGLVFVFGTLAVFLIGVPATRGLLLFGLAGGIVVGFGLYLWRQRT